jgi:hypothetical protein
MIYTWRDPHTGSYRVSSLAPDWYRPDADVSGPRVIVSHGGAVIDDTDWPLAERLEVARRRQQQP